MQKGKFLLILILLITFSPAIIESARLAPRHTSGNIVVRSNTNTSLEEVAINIDLKNLHVDENYKSEGYIKYDEFFHGKFILQNNGDLAEKIIIAYPFYKIYRSSYSFSGSNQPPVDNFEIFVDGKKMNEYEIMHTAGGGGYTLATYTDGRQISIDQEDVESVTCSEDIGPFTSRICKRINDKEECENYGFYCDSLNNTYSCGTCEFMGLDAAPRYKCNSVCKKVICEKGSTSTVCSKCNEIDCIIPYSTNLRDITMAVFKLEMPPHQKKEVDIKYNTVGAGFVEHIMQDDYSWVRPIKEETISFKIEGGKADFVGPRKETIGSLLKEVKKENNITTYVWEFNDFLPLEWKWKDRLYASQYFLDFEVKKPFFNTTTILWLVVILLILISGIGYSLYRKHKKQRGVDKIVNEHQI